MSHKTINSAKPVTTGTLSPAVIPLLRDAITSKLTTSIQLTGPDGSLYFERSGYRDSFGHYQLESGLNTNPPTLHSSNLIRSSARVLKPGENPNAPAPTQKGVSEFYALETIDSQSLSSYNRQKYNNMLGRGWEGFRFHTDEDYIMEHTELPVFRSREELLQHLVKLYPAPPGTQLIFDRHDITHFPWGHSYVDYWKAPCPIARTPQAALDLINSTPRVKTWPVCFSNYNMDLEPFGLRVGSSNKHYFNTVALASHTIKSRAKRKTVRAVSSFNLELTESFFHQFRVLLDDRIHAYHTHHRKRVEAGEGRYSPPRISDLFDNPHANYGCSPPYFPDNSRRGSNTPMQGNDTKFRDLILVIKFYASFDDAINLFKPFSLHRNPRRDILRNTSTRALAHHLNCAIRTKQSSETAKEALSALHHFMSTRVHVSGLHPLPEGFPECPTHRTTVPKPAWNSLHLSCKQATPG